jgi:hypothetical protein
MNLQRTILACVMLLPLRAAGACPEVQHVRIQLIDDARVSPHLLANAAGETAWLLTSLCVQLTWSVHERREGLEIHILPASLTQDKDTSHLGFAMPGFGEGNRGAVFMSHVQRVVADHRDLIDTKTLLGHVLAHEIGHLLLRTRTHSGSGIMQANFDESQLRMARQRRLIFTESDRRTAFRNREVAKAQRSRNN